MEFNSHDHLWARQCGLNRIGHRNSGSLQLDSGHQTLFPEDGLWEGSAAFALRLGEAVTVSPADLTGLSSTEEAFLGSMAEPVSWQCDTNGHRTKCQETY